MTNDNNDGNKPIRTRPLPWELPGVHWVDDNEKNYVDKVIAAASPFRYYGPDLQHYVERLEQAFCDKYQMPYALGVNSGTSALHIALAAFGVGPGDEVLLPGYLWVSCISAIIRLGAIPRLVDIDETFCMSPVDLANKINFRSKAILCVHMSGAPGQIAQIAQIAKNNQLYLLEDCAQAANAKSFDKYVGSFGDAAIFSFQLNKNMTSGEGGMILCRSEEIYQRCFAMHDLGYARNDKGRLDTANEDYQLWGVGSRMSELTAAFALAQFEKIDKITGAMRQAKWKVRNALTMIEGLEFRHVVDAAGDSGPFLITTYPSAKLCQKFTARLNELGIQGPEGSLTCLTMKAWGLHWYYNNASLVNKKSNSLDGFPWSHAENQFAHEIVYDKGVLPVCDDLADRSAILAIASNLAETDCDDIVKAFKQVANEVLV